MKRLWILSLCLVVQISTIAQFNELTLNDWLNDFDDLAMHIRKDHAKPYWLVSEDDFENQVNALRTELSNPGLNLQERGVVLLKLMATFKDGHSSMLGEDRYKLFGYTPINVEWFEDYLYIIRADEQYRQTLGTKLVKIDGLPIAEVVEKLKQVVPHANDSRFKKFSPYYLHMPGLLYGLGISKKADCFTARLEYQGEFFEVKFRQIPEDQETDMVNSDWDLTPIPLYRKFPRKSYWFEYLEDEKLLYFQYNRVTSDKEENIWAFSERLFQFIEEHEIEKFVVDIRNNGGGSGPLSATLWNGIEQNEKINQPGKLFVITGYKTFSAAISFAAYLEMRTHAIFLGENLCDYLQAPGDEKVYSLKNSGLQFGLSSLFHEKSFYQDERSTLILDHKVKLPYSDYSRGIDPVLNYIRSLDYASNTKIIGKADQCVGKYAFSPYEHLEIQKRDTVLWMEIKGKLKSPLYPKNANRFSTEIKGLFITFKEGSGLQIEYPDGKIRQLDKLKKEELDFVGLVYNGSMEEFETKLIQLKNDFPDIQYWRDHSLASLALEVVYDLRAKLGREEARARAKQILEIAIRINPEDHEYAEYSLQYYN